MSTAAKSQAEDEWLLRIRCDDKSRPDPLNDCFEFVMMMDDCCEFAMTMQVGPFLQRLFWICRDDEQWLLQIRCDDESRPVPLPSRTLWQGFHL